MIWKGKVVPFTNGSVRSVAPVALRPSVGAAGGGLAGPLPSMIYELYVYSDTLNQAPTCPEPWPPVTLPLVAPRGVVEISTQVALGLAAATLPICAEQPPLVVGIITVPPLSLPADATPLSICSRITLPKALILSPKTRLYPSATPR